MKAITLNKKQKAKLLEMCKVLFPKYKWEFADDYGSINDETQVDSLIQWKVTGKYSQVFMSANHWFEFCMMHIFKALVINKYSNAPDFYISVLRGENPVDYLYKLFLKIKKNNGKACN